MKDDSFDCTLIAHLRIFLLFYRLLYCLILPENRLFFGIWKVVEIEAEIVNSPMVAEPQEYQYNADAFEARGADEVKQEASHKEVSKVREDKAR